MEDVDLTTARVAIDESEGISTHDLNLWVADFAAALAPEDPAWLSRRGPVSFEGSVSPERACGSVGSVRISAFVAGIPLDVVVVRSFGAPSDARKGFSASMTSDA